MNIEERDNYYVLEEADREEDQSPLNYAAYDHEEDEKEEKVEEPTLESKKSSFGLLLKIMFNPVEGWKTLRRSGITVEGLQGGCFYPLLALLAVSNFAEFFYKVNVNLSEVVSDAIVSFVAFFFGYFCMQMVLSWVLPKDMAQKFEGDFGKKYSIISLSTLALFSIIINLLPMLWPILIFLPIWTLYIMFKATRFFHFEPNQEMKFFVLSGSIAIGLPILIEWGISSLLPY